MKSKSELKNAFARHDLKKIISLLSQSRAIFQIGSWCLETTPLAVTHIPVVANDTHPTKGDYGIWSRARNNTFTLWKQHKTEYPDASAMQFQQHFEHVLNQQDPSDYTQQAFSTWMQECSVKQRPMYFYDSNELEHYKITINDGLIQRGAALFSTQKSHITDDTGDLINGMGIISMFYQNKFDDTPTIAITNHETHYIHHISSFLNFTLAAFGG